MGHSTSSGRNTRNYLDNYRENEMARLLSRGIDEARAGNIAEVNSMQEAIRRFESIYQDTRESTPEQTAERLVNELGERWANAVVGTLVNSAGDDGRISSANRRWASSTSVGAYSPNEGRENRFSTNVHRAHLDQIASAMRRRMEARQIGRNDFSNSVLRRNNRSR